MSPTPDKAPTLRLGDFLYESESGSLKGPDSQRSLRPQLARLLEAFLAEPQRVISKQRLAEAVWGEGRVVEFDAGIAALIKELRSALGDDASQPHYIETVPRRGFRLLLTPEAVREAPGSSRTKQYRPGARALMGILLLLAGVALLWFFLAPAPEPLSTDHESRLPRVAVLPFLSIDESDREQRASLLLADSLIAELGKTISRADPTGETPSFAVIGRSSVAAYPSEEELIRELGQDLRADLIVEGSYRREDEAWLIHVSAVKVQDQTILLSRSFIIEELSSRNMRDHLQGFAIEMLEAVRGCGQACLADH